MTQTLLIAAPVLLWIMTAFYLTAFIALLKLFRQDTSHPIPLLMAGIVFGLCYDAFVLALGAFLGDGALLKILSYPRYILHGALIPLMLPLCAYALEADQKVLKAVGAVTGVLVLLGAVAGLKMSLKALDFAGITRYIADTALTPAWANGLLNLLSIVPTLVLIVCGVILWKKKGKKELTLAGLLMMVFSAIGPATGHMDINFLLSMFGELGMVIFFWIYAKKDAQND